VTGYDVISVLLWAVPTVAALMWIARRIKRTDRELAARRARSEAQWAAQTCMSMGLPPPTTHSILASKSQSAIYLPVTEHKNPRT
jgi:hypothetical protein